MVIQRIRVQIIRRIRVQIIRRIRVQIIRRIRVRVIRRIRARIIRRITVRKEMRLVGLAVGVLLRRRARTNCTSNASYAIRCVWRIIGIVGIICHLGVAGAHLPHRRPRTTDVGCAAVHRLPRQPLSAAVRLPSRTSRPGCPVPPPGV
jgi:hypothetical protein